jgi:hypothetical protein
MRGRTYIFAVSNVEKEPGMRAITGEADGKELIDAVPSEDHKMDR